MILETRFYLASNCIDIHVATLENSKTKLQTLLLNAGNSARYFGFPYSLGFLPIHWLHSSLARWTIYTLSWQLMDNRVVWQQDLLVFISILIFSQQTFRSMLHVNVFSVTFMTSLVLPKMLEKNKGAIVNIGSASCYGFPLLSVYAATKAYVDSFSQNLQYEYGHTGRILTISWI